MVTKTKRRPGPASLFPGKIRKPVTLTLTPAHHRKVRDSVQRLQITRADLIGLLIDKHAETVTKEYARAYKRLRDAVEALGGTLEHVRRNERLGGTWVLRLGGKELRVISEQSKRYAILDACYELKDGVTVSQTWEDHTDVINPDGLAKLFARLASSAGAEPE